MQKENIKKIIVIGLAILIIWILVGNNFSYITDWSSSQLVGYNIWTIFVIAGVSFLAYRNLKPKNKP